MVAAEKNQSDKKRIGSSLDDYVTFPVPKYIKKI